MRAPKVKFTPWKHWTKRTEIDGADGPGVYLLAHFPRGQVPRGNASPLDPNLVYSGETMGKLSRRWNDFDRSAQTGKKGHAGGRTYHERFHKIRGNLYVAAYCPKQSKWTSRCHSFFVRYVEARLVWEFAMTHVPDQLGNKD
jgi:hypothetical protein